MTSLNELKKKLRVKTDKDPDSYYPTEVLKERGYSRKKCSNCGNYFWSRGERNVCGEPECSGGYSFIDDPVGKRMDYVETWKDFSKHMNKRGYESIKRYPVVARWRDDSYWTNASIYDFQPYVVSGEVDPPANPLVVPQMCVRFNSIDSVGISGRHNTSFVMIGQHAFKKPSEFEQTKYFEDYFTWFTDSVKIPEEELVVHEDQWGGGGNLGVSMEVFSRGLELGNQVYMNYEVTGKGYRELETKVLDMGMGQARPAWLTQGEHTMYQVAFPEACDYLFKQTGVEETETYRKFLPYSGILNVDEIEDMEKGWKQIADRIGVSKGTLKEEVMPVAALYSIAGHMHTLLFAVTDGAIPSNTSGGHNLRTIYRRAYDFMQEYGWDLDLDKVMEKHAQYLEPEFPEVKEHLEEVSEVLDHEEKKYRKTLKKSKGYIEKFLDKEKITPDEIMNIYDTRGISPEVLRKEAEKRGKKIEIPPDLYARITLKHAKPEEKEKKKEFEVDVSEYDKTDELYHGDRYEFTAKVMGNEEIDGKNYVVLDRTAFYPEAGGQEPDHGTLNGKEVKEVQKVKGIILHETDEKLQKGKEVRGKVDEERRKSLTVHHTATHVINGAAKRVLGDHVWQEGAKKYADRARLDVTHFEVPSKEEIKEIEKKANEVVKKDIKVEKKIMKKNEAEAKYGFRIYQGGHVPGNNIRIIKIGNWDVEACGGTHCNSTGELGPIKIFRITKKQDGVIRIEYVVGKKAVEKYLGKEIDRLRSKINKLHRELKEQNEKISQLEGERKEEEFKPEETLKLEDKEEEIERLKQKRDKMLEKWKKQRKEIDELREEKAQKAAGEGERVRYMENVSMDLMNKIASKEVEEDPSKFIIIVTGGQVIGRKGPKSTIDIKIPVTSTAEMMGGSAGGTEYDMKGGGPKKEKSKEAYEEAKRLVREQEED